MFQDIFRLKTFNTLKRSPTPGWYKIIAIKWKNNRQTDKHSRKYEGPTKSQTGWIAGTQRSKNLYHGLSGGKTIIIQRRDDTGNCQDKSSWPFQYPRGQNGRTSNNTQRSTPRTDEEACANVLASLIGTLFCIEIVISFYEKYIVLTNESWS